MKTLGAALVLSCLLAGAGLAPAQVAHAGTSRADDPAVGSPEYVARDTQNIADAYGRITDQQLGEKVQESALYANKELGVNATPTFFINGKKVSGALGIAEWDKELAPLLAGK